MATLGTQNISTSYNQLLKVASLNPISGSLQAITSGNDISSALSLSTSEVKSTGSFAVDGTSLLSGVVTFGTSLTASTGTATIGTLSVGTATISTATIPAITLSTATISTASISTATIPLQLGTVTFGSNITASTGTATFGTESVGISTIGTLNVTTNATLGTARITGSTGGITSINYGTVAFTTATIPTSGSSTGTFAINGLGLNDIVIGSLNSIGSATGSQALSFFVFAKAANVAGYTLCNVNNTTISTVPAGTIYATAMRFTS